MAKYKGWKKRYSYLDDYKPGMDGKYVYYGRHYIFEGTNNELRRYKLILGLADILFTALFIIGGCIDAGVIWNTWYVIVPFAAEVVAIFLLIWKTLTMIVEKVPIKAYLYKKSVPWFRPLLIILMITDILSLCMTALCMLLNPESIKVSGCIIYMVIKLLTALAAWILTGILKKNNWELDPSEEMEE